MTIYTQDTERYLEAPPEDLNLYFSDTFLKVREKGKEKDFYFCYMRDFRFSDRDNIPVVLYNSAKVRGGSIRKQLAELEFDFQFPQVGMYNFRKTVCFFQRTTARQNKKALCKGTALMEPVHNFVGAHAPGVPYAFQLRNQWSWSLATVERTFGQPKYLTVAEGYEAVAKCKAFARALSKNFFIAPGIRDVYPSLWFRRTLVGEVLNPKHIQVSNGMFNQEVIDELSQKGVRISAA